MKWTRLPGVKPYSYSATVPFGGLAVGLHVSEGGSDGRGRGWKCWLEISGWEIWVGFAPSGKEAKLMVARKLRALAGETQSAAKGLEG